MLDDWRYQIGNRTDLPKSIERFQARWIPVRIKKTRQNKNLMPRSDPIGTGH